MAIVVSDAGQTLPITIGGSIDNVHQAADLTYSAAGETIAERLLGGVSRSTGSTTTT